MLRVLHVKSTSFIPKFDNLICEQSIVSGIKSPKFVVNTIFKEGVQV